MKSIQLTRVRTQRGVATILVVMLVSLVMMGAIGGAGYYLRSKQQAMVSNHAVTNAQSGAWAGVELVRQYLNGLSGTQLVALNGVTNKVIIPNTDPDKYLVLTQIKSRDVSDIGTTGKKYRVFVDIFYQSKTAKSASKMQVAYEIIPPESRTSDSSSGGSSSSGTSAINIYTNANSTGTITITGASSSENVVMTVDGKAVLNEVTGIDTLNVTGTVTISNSSTQIDNVYADDDVTIKSATVKSINTKKSITLENGTFDTLKAGVDITQTGGSKINQYAWANNDISFSSNSVFSNNTHIDYQAKAGNELTCPSNSGQNKDNWYKKIAALLFNDVGTNCESEAIATANGRTRTTLTNSDLPVIALSELGVSAQVLAPKINALCYDPVERAKTGSEAIECETNSVYKSGDTANYVFYGATSNNIPLVRVYNLSVYDNDTAYCVKENNGHFGYLYEYSNGACGSEIKGNIAQLNSNNKVSISYSYQEKKIENVESCTVHEWSQAEQWYSRDCITTQVTVPATAVWTLKHENYSTSDTVDFIKKPSVAPGVLLFKGDLTLDEGVYNNTIIATGDINGSGNNTLLHAPNYAVSSANNDASVVCHASSGVSTFPYFATPTNLCNIITANDTTTYSMKNSVLGDIVLLAGSYTGEYSESSYIGGDIYMKTGKTIYGNIIAGGVYSSSGSTTLYGFLTSAGLSNSNATTTLTGTLKIIVPTTNNKNVGGSSSDSNLDNSSSSTDGAKYLWMRYL